MVSQLQFCDNGDDPCKYFSSPNYYAKANQSVEGREQRKFPMCFLWQAPEGYTSPSADLNCGWIQQNKGPVVQVTSPGHKP
jgi:hypothetical protein